VNVPLHPGHPRGIMWPLPGRSRILSRCFQESIDRGITRYRVLHIQFIMYFVRCEASKTCACTFQRFRQTSPSRPFPLPPLSLPNPHREPPHPPISLHRIPHPLFRLLIVHISASSFRNLSQWFFLPREKLLMSMLFLP